MGSFTKKGDTMNVIYEKKLACGGTLVVLKHRWYVAFEEQGPDSRYKKKPFQIADKEIKNFCNQLKRNFDLYEEKKAQGDFTMIRGEGGQWIRFGVREGVCIFDQSYPIKRREMLSSILEELEQVEKIAEYWIKKSRETTNIEE